MLASIVEILLSKYLHKIFYGIEKKNIDVALFDGKFTISNIGLQQNLLNSLKLPIQLEYSYVQKMEVSIPWLSDQVSLNIYISNMYALVVPKQNIDVYQVFMKGKQKAVEDAIKMYLAKLQQKPKDQKQPGSIERLLIKLLDNVNINIGCIHFRYQSKQKKYSFGLKINQITAYNVNKQGKKQFFSRQKSSDNAVRYTLSVDFIGLYFNSNQVKFLHKNKQTVQKDKKKVDYAYITNQMRYLSLPQKLGSVRSNQLHYVFILSVKTLLKKHFFLKDNLISVQKQTPYFQCQVQFKSVQTKITVQQYYDIKELVEFFTSYQGFWRQYVNFMNLNPYKQKSSIDISQILVKKNKKQSLNKKQKLSIKRNITKYLQWIFKSVYQQSLKKTFIFQALKKQITLENMLKNKKIVSIMRKIDQQKLKSWVIISMMYRKKFDESTNFLQKNNSAKVKQFLNKTIGPFQPFRRYEDLLIQNSPKQNTKQRNILFKLDIKVHKMSFQISKLDKFGVTFFLSNIRAHLLLRDKNFGIQIKLEDLQASVFSSKNVQLKRTYVPIIKKNIILQPSIDLLYLKYQKSPIGRPFIYAQYQLDFQSIQITIYPEAFKQFYEILFASNKKSLVKVQSSPKKKVIRKEQQVNNEFRSVSFQKNMVRGKIRSPWIIFPLGRNNNPQKQCWVVRLGDFILQTPEIEMVNYKNQKQLYYDKYKLQLRQFELKYFSSVNFFYNWLKLNQQYQKMKQIQFYKNQKIISMIKPFSCFIDFQMIKSNLAPVITNNNYAYISNIYLQGIQIFLSNFLLDKLKQRIDLIGEQQNYQNFQFVQTAVNNIYQEHSISGWGQVTYQRFCQTKLFFVLRGSFIYFFAGQNQKKYYFFIDVQKVNIRLMSNRMEKFNQQKSKKLVLYLNNIQSHQQWRKHINNILQKKQRKLQNTYQQAKITNQSPIFKPKQEKYSKLKQQKLKPLGDLNRRRSKKSQRQEQQLVQIPEAQIQSKACFSFIMSKLQIRLRDKTDKQFLYCQFKKSNLTYRFLFNKQASFTLSGWDIYQNNVVTQISTQFLSSKKFFNQQQTLSINDNFLQVQLTYNEITNQLNSIQVQIDKLFIAWKVDLITKILVFFFYPEDVGDAPTPLNLQKRKLSINFNIKKFFLYCYQNQELVGLIKTNNISILYFQSNIEEYFEVRCKKFQVQRSIQNSLRNREAIMLSKSQENPMYLKYHIRKQRFSQFKNVSNLKKQFGTELIVSELTCNWKDSIIYYQHQIAFRILNYFLNNVLGTVGAKFKKREYSTIYILQLLKTNKIGAMKINFQNFTFIIPPHEKKKNHLVMDVEQFLITKNIRSQPEYRPKKVIIPTIKQDITTFYQTMIFEFMGVILSYQYGLQKSMALNSQKLNFIFLMSKVNFQKQYYPILKHHDDFDRQMIVKVDFINELQLQFHKIVFLTLLQIFYQNVRHKDGKAQIFDPPLPYPSYRQYIITFPKLNLNMYQYIQKNQKMEIFNFIEAFKFQITYNQIGQKSIIIFKSNQLRSTGQLKLQKYGNQQIFIMEMTSSEGKSKLQIQIEGYKINFSFDQLNNILQYINYDSDFVANQIMAKKPSSFMGINVFAKKCKLTLEQLYVQGDFYVTYLKNAQNSIQKQLINFVRQKNQEITSHINSSSSAKKEQIQNISLNSKIDWDDIADKQIKVDGQNLKLSIKGDQIGKIQSLYFHRIDISSKSNNKRFKKQIVQIGESMLYLQISDFTKIFSAYDKRIKKNPNLIQKHYFQPWNSVPLKIKMIQRRRTQVEFNRVSAFLLSSQKQKLIFYFNAEIRIPKLIYSTFKDYQNILVQISAHVCQLNHKIRPMVVGQIKKLKFSYTNQKDIQKKTIEIQNGKNMKILLANLQNQSLYKLVEQIKSKQQKSRKYINYNYAKHLQLKSNFIVRNTTSYLVKVSLAKFNLEVQSYSQLRHDINYEQLLQIFKQNWNLNLKIGNQLELAKKLYQITLNQQICIVNDVLLRCSYNHNSFSLQLFQSCIVKNNAKVSFILNFMQNKPIQIKSSQQKCIFFMQKQQQKFQKLSFMKKIQKITLSLNVEDRQFSQSQQIAIEVGQYFIFNGLAIVLILKERGFYKIIIKQRFKIQNFTPFRISLGRYNGIQRQVNYEQIDFFSCGLSHNNERISISQIKRRSANSEKSFAFILQDVQFQVNLLQPQQYFQVQIPFESLQAIKILNQEKSFKKQNKFKDKDKVKVYIKKQKYLDIQVLTFFTVYIVKNISNQQLLFNALSYQNQATKSKSQFCGYRLENNQISCISQKWVKLSIYNQNRWKQNQNSISAQTVFLKQDLKANKDSQKDKKLYKIEQCFCLINSVVQIGTNKIESQNIIQISNTVSCLNYSNFIIKIKDGNSYVSLFSNQQKQLRFDTIDKNNLVEVCFFDIKSKIKYHRSLIISQNNIYYLQIGQDILKIIIMQKQINERMWLRILIQNSKQGYQINNKLDDVVLIIKNGQNNFSQNKTIQKIPKLIFEQDGYLQQSKKYQYLLQPLEFKSFGLKQFNDKDKLIKIQFYYPLKNIDFKQNVVIDLEKLPQSPQQLILLDPKTKFSIDLVYIFQKEKEDTVNITFFKKKSYRIKQNQTLTFIARQISLSLELTQQINESITLQICQLHATRQKGPQLLNIQVKIKQILLKQGQTDSIISMLDNKSQFINFQVILSKNTRGLCAKSLIIKFCPFQINGRQRIFMKLLQKVSKIRSFQKNKIAKGQTNKRSLRISSQRQKINLQVPINQLHIKQQLQNLKKGNKPIVIQNMQIYKSTILMSYIKSKQPLFSHESQFGDPIIKYFLLLPSISQTKIPIPHFQIKDFKGSSKQLLKQIAKQLKSSIGQTVLYSLTSLTIFDNPITALDDIIRYITTILTIM